MKIILASQSPRRRQLAAAMGLDFEVEPSRFEEHKKCESSPDNLAIELAHGKAQEVASRRSGLIIGMDTFVWHDGAVLGKPESREHARELLQRISGETLYVYTGIVLINTDTGREKHESVETRVTMHEMSAAEIKTYVDTEEPLDKAGAFAVQGYGAVFIKEIHGCYFNVVGFPSATLYHMLTEMGINPATGWQTIEHPR